MTKLLLILVLFGPGDKAAGERIAASLGDLGAKTARVVSGPEAVKELDRHGVKDADFAASPELGQQLTRKGDLVVVRVEGRASGGDSVLETTVWSRGHVEHHVSIAGTGQAAIDGAVRGVIAIIAPILPEPEDGAADEARLAQLADTGSWEEVLQLVAPFGPPPPKPHSPRWAYYEVLALVRLNRVEPAREALERMRAAFPEHVLTETASTLVAPLVPKPEPAPGEPEPSLR